MIANLFFTALIVFAGGFSIRAPILAVMSEFINALKETGRLYMLISMTDALAHIIRSLVIESILGLAVDLSGPWLVLQFIIIVRLPIDIQLPMLTCLIGMLLYSCSSHNVSPYKKIGNFRSRQ